MWRCGIFVAMSFALRLLLALLLVLNGTGSVAAAARMAVASHGAATTAAAGHCESMAQGGQAAQPAADPLAHDSHPDCCKRHACDCACVPAASVAVLPLLPAPLAFQRSVSSWFAASPLPAPVLPFPLRPPIA